MKKRTIIAMCMGGVAMMMAAQAPDVLPFRNPALSFEERADDLLSRLTLEEKASLMIETSPAIPRLAFPNGAGGAKRSMALHATAPPQFIPSPCSWHRLSTMA